MTGPHQTPFHPSNTSPGGANSKQLIWRPGITAVPGLTSGCRPGHSAYPGHQVDCPALSLVGLCWKAIKRRRRGKSIQPTTLGWSFDLTFSPQKGGRGSYRPALSTSHTYRRPGGQVTAPVTEGEPLPSLRAGPTPRAVVPRHPRMVGLRSAHSPPCLSLGITFHYTRLGPAGPCQGQSYLVSAILLE